MAVRLPTPDLPTINNDPPGEDNARSHLATNSRSSSIKMTSKSRFSLPKDTIPIGEKFTIVEEVLEKASSFNLNHYQCKVFIIQLPFSTTCSQFCRGRRPKPRPNLGNGDLAEKFASPDVV